MLLRSDRSSLKPHHHRLPHHHQLPQPQLPERRKDRGHATDIGTITTTTTTITTTTTDERTTTVRIMITDEGTIIAGTTTTDEGAISVAATTIGVMIIIAVMTNTTETKTIDGTTIATVDSRGTTKGHIDHKTYVKKDAGHLTITEGNHALREMTYHGHNNSKNANLYRQLRLPWKEGSQACIVTTVKNQDTTHPNAHANRKGSNQP